MNVKTKRIISTACAIGLMGACTLPAAAMAAEPEIIASSEVGNVNGDYMTDSTDATLLMQYYSYISTGGEMTLTAEQFNTADVDGDGKIDSADSSAVLQYYAYLSTIDYYAKPMSIRMYLKPEAPFAAPEGLDPGKPGTMRYRINTEPLHPHDEIPLFNVKGDNDHGGEPYISRYYTVTETDKAIMRRFAAEHFTDDMTNYDRLECAWNWLHHNLTYADGQNGRPQYSEIWSDSFVSACFEKKAAQCIQYNGAFAEMMAYMGYDVYMLEKWNGANFTNQHFASEAVITGVSCSTEVGNVKEDNPKTGYKWMWLFDEKKAVLAADVKAAVEAAEAEKWSDTE